MRRIHYGILLAVSSPILNTGLSHLVYFPIRLSHFHEITHTAGPSLLDPQCRCSNAGMDMLHIIWMSQWAFDAGINPHLIYG